MYAGHTDKVFLASCRVSPRKLHNSGVFDFLCKSFHCSQRSYILESISILSTGKAIIYDYFFFLDNCTSRNCFSLDGYVYIITKTCLYNVGTLKPHFYIVKLGFTGVYIIFHNSAQKHRLWVLVRAAVLTSTHNLCFEQKYKKYQNLYLKFFIFCW